MMSEAQEPFTYDELVGALRKSQEYGFLSPQPVENQIEHSLEFISLCPSSDERIVDLGAGGGLPSLVLLYARPDSRITAIDAMGKRTDFLKELAEQFPGIGNRLKVVNGRAEEIAQREVYRESRNLVLARGFGPPAVTAECAAGLLSLGGYLVVSGRPEDELSRWDEKGLNELGLAVKELRSGEKSHAVIIEKVSVTEARYPRRAAAIKKAPLWK